MPRVNEGALPTNALQQSEAVSQQLFEHVEARQDLAVVQAPPGSGKTRLLVRAVARARQGRHPQLAAIAAQTNAQADDICRRLGGVDGGVRCIRFASDNYPQQQLGSHVQWETESKRLTAQPGVVVATTAKWSTVNLPLTFDLLFIEEAWQMSWADFVPLGQVSGRFILIGDPGQIPPVVTIDTSRWGTAVTPPHLAAPELILNQFASRALTLKLPATHRLPHDSADLVRPFYDFEFSAIAEPQARRLIASGNGSTRFDGVVDYLARGSVVAATVPTSEQGPPLERDDELADHCVAIATRLLQRQVDIAIDGNRKRLEAKDIGFCATHRVMNRAIDLRLPSSIRGVARVDTPERWQGLERPVMVVVHPLSGQTNPAEFALETGRLCVMASRHQVGLVIVSRDHITNTLDSHLPSARQALGRPDVAGRGHAQNIRFWNALLERDRVVA